MTISDPPHSLEVERAVLGPILDGRYPEAADRLITAGGRELFFGVNHRFIVRAIELMRESRMAVDLTTVSGAMTRMSYADAKLNCGSSLRLESETQASGSLYHALGQEVWTDILLIQGSWSGWATNLEHLVAFHRQRQAIGALTAATARLSDPDGSRDVVGIVSGLRTSLEAFLPIPEALPLTMGALLNYPQQDPNTLLGDRWLAKGGSCLINGQTGIGKSTFCIQAAITWALGMGLFGIMPARPLTSLIVQAENDTGDLAEMVRGVVAGLACQEHVAELDQRLRFVTDAGHSGAGFIEFIRAHIDREKPDLVWIDPLLSFIGGDVSKQEVASAFLRNGLGSIAQDTGVCWMVMHHTNKPPKDAPKMAMANGDYAYLGTGSSELANWARAILVLREIPNMDRVYELRCAKRGRRSGMTDGSGRLMTEIPIRHAEQGIHWERAAVAEDQQEDELAEHVHAILEEMELGRVYRPAEIQRLMADYYKVSKSTVLTKKKPKRRIYDAVLAMTQTLNGHLVTTRSPTGHVTRHRSPGHLVTPLKGGEPGVTSDQTDAVERGHQSEGVTTGEEPERTIDRGPPPDNWGTSDNK